jgi:hypothetical protein
MSNAIYFTRYTNELNGQSTMEWVSLLLLMTSNSIRLIIWLKELFESGLQYVYHNLQPQKSN